MRGDFEIKSGAAGSSWTVFQPGKSSQGGFASEAEAKAWALRNVEPFKVCGCGRRYQTRADWSALPEGRIHSTEDGSLADERRCPCDSHIVATLIAPLSVGELRKAVRLIDSMNEGFNDDYTAQEMLWLVRVCWDSGWDVYPDQWTGQQIAAALTYGTPPDFEERASGLHARNVSDCGCGACRGGRERED